MTSVYIIVYRGSPIDSPSNRHTGIFLKFPDNTTTIAQISGPNGGYYWDEVPNVDPQQSGKWIKSIPVDTIDNQYKAVIINAIQTVYIANEDKSWNCQHWVGAALDKLVGKQWIDQQRKSLAIGAMADIVADAPDEDP